jgi:hypothetical protein
MEKVIERAWQDFGSTNFDGSQNMIDKIKKHIDSRSGNGDAPKTIAIFKDLLSSSRMNIMPLTNYPQQPLFNAHIHCESSLAAILCQLHCHDGLDSNDELRNFFQVNPSLTLIVLHSLTFNSKIAPTCLTVPVTYSISVSKSCCPVCWELLDVLNETYSNMIHFTVRPPHQNLYPVCLPPWLPDDVLEKMIQRFGRKLYDKLHQLPDI